ncbi:hypothetical protein DER44DRAFT_853468, partial [Fusarium oxysporum]
GCDLAKYIFQWLKSLELPRSLRGQGSCSLCTHTWHPCQHICKSCTITVERSPREKAMLVEKFNSKSGADGHYERKPLVKRVIASLCAYDISFSEISLARWRWIPRLMFDFEILVLAFYYKQNSLAGLPSFQGFPCDPPGSTSAPTADRIDEIIGLEDWEKNDQVTRRKACIEWWEDRCSFCVGQGFTGSSVFHHLRECEKGGAGKVRLSLWKLIYEDGYKRTSGCARCLMPKEFCPRWGKRLDAEWYQRDKVLWEFRYNRHLLYDTIVGLLQCGKDEFKEKLACSAEQH